MSHWLASRTVHCSLDAIPNAQLSKHLVDVFVDRIS